MKSGSFPCSMVRLLALCALCAACGGGGGPRARVVPLDVNDPHRRLTVGECARLYDHMHELGALAEADAPRDTVVKGCVEAPDTTKAFYDCVLQATTREEADRCQ